MRSKEKVKPADRLYLIYTEHRSGGEVCAGQEDDDWPSHEDENIDWHLIECRSTRTENHWYQEEVEIDFQADVGSIVYVVYVRYGTGGTFGHTNGAWVILGIYKTEQEAINVKKSVDDDTYDGRVYKCWTGYFECLESCEVESMKVEGDSMWNLVKLR